MLWILVAFVDHWKYDISALCLTCRIKKRNWTMYSYPIFIVMLDGTKYRINNPAFIPQKH